MSKQGQFDLSMDDIHKYRNMLKERLTLKDLL